jgi:alkaline phosphatase
MGFEQVKAAGMYAHGVEGTLSFESFPYRAEVTTHSASSSITDSAASGTAMATGFKVNNRVLSTAIPGDGGELETVLERLRDQGKSTGLVSTAFMTHATPAAFGSHEDDRGNYNEIAQDYLTQTRPDVLLGGGAHGMTPTMVISAGYTVVTDTVGLLALNTETITMTSGLFGDTHLPYEYDGLGSLPHLSEMTEVALNILDNDPEGFFLMVEGARIDHAGHANDIQRMISETIEFANAVSVAIDWSQGLTNTLILVTADHETGGLSVLQNNGQGELPTVSWSTDYHTAANVPLYGWGAGAYLVSGVLDNTDIYHILAPTAISGLQAANDGPTFLGWETTLSATAAAGTGVSYRWAFGDGEYGEGMVVNHTYQAEGPYTAVVTATNPLGEDYATTTVTVIEPYRVALPLVVRGR